MAAAKVEEFTEFSSEVIGFDSTYEDERILNLVDTCTATDPMPEQKDKSVETNKMCAVETQTEILNAGCVEVDEKKLSAWLRKIYPKVELELRKGPTPILADNNRNSDDEEKNSIRTHQKIKYPSKCGSQGLATWLSIRTNNASALVLSTAGLHDNWCTHNDATMKIYIPTPSNDFIVFTLLTTIPLKSCLRSLITNPFDKNIFSASTVTGTIHIWKYQPNENDEKAVEELFSIESPYGCIVSMDWSEKRKLLTCHQDGWIVQWSTDGKMQQEEEILVRDQNKITQELTTIVCIEDKNFIVGTIDGGIFHYSKANCRQNEFAPLKKHRFTVTSLMKTKISGRTIVISCDLSGQVFYHDVPNFGDDDGTRVIAQIPLPFKNAIAASREGNTIYCPGVNGALEIYRVMRGSHSSINGILEGKGNMIRASDNGSWIVTGLYGDEFQIFKLDDN